MTQEQHIKPTSVTGVGTWTTIGSEVLTVTARACQTVGSYFSSLQYSLPGLLVKDNSNIGIGHENPNKTFILYTLFALFKWNCYR